MASNPTKPAPFSAGRAAVVFLVLGAAFVALVGRVAYLQTVSRRKNLERAERQQHRTDVFPARRGCLYDRNGIEMAGTVQRMALFIDPKFMQDEYQKPGRSLVEMDRAIEQLAHLADIDSFAISQLLGERAESRYVKVPTPAPLDDSTCAAIRKLDVPGVGLEPVNVRYYPMGSLAAHVLGGTGGEGKGLEGIELEFEKLLAGRDGYQRSLKDSRHRPIATAAEDYLPPQHGQHLVLTIDSNIQMIAEQELAATCKHFRAAAGEVVVMDPRNGEVLALANWPAFNPQNMEDSTADLRRNRCVTDHYEPGSTIKPFIVGPALSARVTRPTEVFPIDGPTYKTPYGRTIRDVHGYEKLCTWDVLVKSSNIGMSMLAERMGNGKLHAALTGFGFGKPTGIELPGERSGYVSPLKKWNKYSTESVAQGYELMVTPVQLARGFSAYANGGRLVKPTLVKGVLDADGRVVAKNPSKGLDQAPRAVEGAAAEQMRRILCDTVVRGTATKARSKTWNVFGKTGTAHKSLGRGGYSEEKYTSSFLAGAPAEDPRLVVAFIIHEPDKSIAHYGGTVSAPGAGNLIERTLTYLQVPPSPPLDPPAPQVASVLWKFDPKVYQVDSGARADTRE